MLDGRKTLIPGMAGYPILFKHFLIFVVVERYFESKYTV